MHTSDRGTTLVELVVTVLIMSVVVAPVLSAFATTVRASAGRDRAAVAETVLQNAADRVNRAPLKCDYSVYVQAAALSQGWTASSASVAMAHWRPGATPSAAGTWVAGGCDGASVTPLLVQRVTITITSPTTGVVRTLQVVKSNV
jgi:Tfp pilus assembly protein PilE